MTTLQAATSLKEIKFLLHTHIFFLVALSNSLSAVLELGEFV